MHSDIKHFSYWRRKRVRDETGLSDTTLWRKEKANEFPRSYRISTNIVAYRSDEVQEWMRSQLATDKETKQ